MTPVAASSYGGRQGRPTRKFPQQKRELISRKGKIKGELLTSEGGRGRRSSFPSISDWGGKGTRKKLPLTGRDRYLLRLRPVTRNETKASVESKSVSILFR